MMNNKANISIATPMVKTLFWSFIYFCLITSCASPLSQNSLYQQLGERRGIETIADKFINGIGESDRLYPFFAESSVDRFKEKFIEHICMVSDGPCQYTGDSMRDVHANMGINEAVFNHTVEVLIDAMTATNVPHNVQNQLLARLAPMRKDIIYIQR